MSSNEEVILFMSNYVKDGFLFNLPVGQNLLKCLTVVSSIFLKRSPVGQASTMIVGLCFYMAVFASALPYKKDINNFLELSLCGVDLFQVVLGLLSHSDAISEKVAEVALFVLCGLGLVLSAFGCCYAVCWSDSEGTRRESKPVEVQMKNTRAQL